MTTTTPTKFTVTVTEDAKVLGDARRKAGKEHDVSVYITAGELPGEGRIADDAGSYIDFDRARLADPLAEWIIAQAWAMHPEYRDVWAAMELTRMVDDPAGLERGGA